MRLSPLRHMFLVLAAFALVTASVTMSMASVMEAATIVEASMSTDAQSEAMPGCANCGRSAVPASVCTLHCMIPAADIAGTAILILLPDAVPVAGAVSGFAGRVPAPDLHPPRAAA